MAPARSRQVAGPIAGGVVDEHRGDGVVARRSRARRPRFGFGVGAVDAGLPAAACVGSAGPLARRTPSARRPGAAGTARRRRCALCRARCWPPGPSRTRRRRGAAAASARRRIGGSGRRRTRPDCPVGTDEPGRRAGPHQHHEFPGLARRLQRQRAPTAAAAGRARSRGAPRRPRRWRARRRRARCERRMRGLTQPDDAAGDGVAA